MTNFDKAFQYTVYTWEGGAKITNDPLDPGGLTKYGICKKYNPNVDVSNLTEDGAKEVYRDEYWTLNGLGGVTRPAMAAKAFDACVNPGPGVASRLIQKACVQCGQEQVAVDGHIGPKSIAAMNAVDEGAWLTAFCTLLSRYYEDKPDSPSKARFLKGWLRRATSVPMFS